MTSSFKPTSILYATVLQPQLLQPILVLLTFFRRTTSLQNPTKPFTGAIGPTDSHPRTLLNLLDHSSPSAHSHSQKYSDDPAPTTR
jgi:hypothetical protein